MKSETKRSKLNHPIYCITSEQHSLGRSNLEVCRHMAEAGIKIIQYREKEKTKKEKYEECLALRPLTKEYGITFIVNDDVDIALAVGADGIHVGQEDMPLDAVRRLAGPEMIIGLSTHSPEQAREAVAKGADYIGVGPLYFTATKKNVGAPLGLEYLAHVAKNIELPFVAIGGIKAHNISEVVRQGARCVALVTEIVGAPDIKGKIAELQNLYSSALK